MEREGRTEEKKIEEEERQPIVKPSEEKKGKIAETVEVREGYKMKRRHQRDRQDQRQKNMQLPVNCICCTSQVTYIILLWINTPFLQQIYIHI